MQDWQLNTPVALIIFNRPDTTARVFDAIRRARPSKLLVIADGPRPNRPEDAAKCAATRAVVEKVDWPCEVLRNYSDVNLGCGVRPATGISWVFEQVEEAIILEDDCLPHPTFFRYCQELLEKYRDDERVMHIAGNNDGIASRRSDAAYYYSIFPHCWGWATWRRAWRHFDFNMSLAPRVLREGWLYDIFRDRRAAGYWAARFREVCGKGSEHIWDFQWTFACWINGGLSITPNRTLISNIGCSLEATHTKDKYSPFAELPLQGMAFPLEHPPFMIRDVETDMLMQRVLFKPKAIVYMRALYNLVRHPKAGIAYVRSVLRP